MRGEGCQTAAGAAAISVSLILIVSMAMIQQIDRYYIFRLSIDSIPSLLSQGFRKIFQTLNSDIQEIPSPTLSVCGK